MAAVVALLNDYRLSNGLSSLGFLNPLIYASPEGFVDITSGSNPGCDTDGKRSWALVYVNDANGCYRVPGYCGVGSGDWDGDARFCGVAAYCSRGVGKEEGHPYYRSSTAYVPSGTVFGWYRGNDNRIQCQPGRLQPLGHIGCVTLPSGTGHADGISQHGESSIYGVYRH